MTPEEGKQAVTERVHEILKIVEEKGWLKGPQVMVTGTALNILSEAFTQTAREFVLAKLLGMQRNKG